MANVELFVWSYCPFCKNAKQLLDSRGIEYVEHVMDDKEEELSELRQKTGQRTVPQIFIGEKFIGGFDELQELNNSGDLDTLLNE